MTLNGKTTYYGYMRRQRHYTKAEVNYMVEVALQSKWSVKASKVYSVYRDDLLIASFDTLKEASSICRKYERESKDLRR